MSSPSSPQVVVIGASTGGPRAVEALFSKLPASINAVVVAALHMPAAFTGPYAARVQRGSKLKVTEGRDGDRLRPGEAVILPGGLQAEVGRMGGSVHLALRAAAFQDLYAPSANQVMQSAARSFGQNCIGVVLTGMGADGADGLSAIRAAGGYTIAESKDSAVIYGMPGEAVRQGSAVVQLGLDEIPAVLLARCGLCP